MRFGFFPSLLNPQIPLSGHQSRFERGFYGHELKVVSTTNLPLGEFCLFKPYVFPALFFYVFKFSNYYVSIFPYIYSDILLLIDISPDRSLNSAFSYLYLEIFLHLNSTIRIRCYTAILLFDYLTTLLSWNVLIFLCCYICIFSYSYFFIHKFDNLLIYPNSCVEIRKFEYSEITAISMVYHDVNVFKYSYFRVLTFSNYHSEIARRKEATKA